MNKRIVEVPFLGTQQQAPDSHTPPGRLKRIQNAVATKFEDGRLHLSQRGGFLPLAGKITNPDDGSVIQATSGFAATPRLLSSLGEQLVVVADSKPHVNSIHDASWSQFQYQLPTNVINHAPWLTTTESITNPDGAHANGIDCYVWKQKNETTNVVSCWVTIRDESGTPLLLPFSVQSSSTLAMRIKVVSDGTRFWVFVSKGTAMYAIAYSTTGQFIDSVQFAALESGETWGVQRWDVIFDASGVVKWFGGDSGTGNPVELVHFTMPSSTIVSVKYDLTVALGYEFYQCWWLTNIHHTTTSFIATYTSGVGIKVHRTSATGTITATYTVAGSIPSVTANQGAGYVDASLVVHVLVSQPHASRHSLDFTNLYNCTAPSTTTLQLLKSVSPASRVFHINGRPCCYFYYTDASGQATYFILDLVARQMVGTLCHGFAAMDWIYSALPYDSADNFHCSTPFVDIEDNIRCNLGYQSETFNRGTLTSVSTNSAIAPFQSVTVNKWVSVVGLSDVSIGTDGTCVEYADELLMTGPIASVFTGAHFVEDGFTLYPPPFVITPTHVDAANLVYNSVISYVLVWAWVDNNGNRVRSRPSDPQIVTLTGTQNYVTLTVDSIQMTNKADAQLEVYRTFLLDTGEPTEPSTEHRKISDDLRPTLNDKSTGTITFIDNVSDAAAQLGQELYTDIGRLPVDACPAFSSGCVAGARAFVVGYDGAIYFSNEKEPGRPLEFNVDVLRMVPPTTETIKALRALDSGRIIVLNESSIWEWDVTALPGPDGLGGNIQTPKELPDFFGCSGVAATTDGGIVYSSPRGGPAVVTRGLENNQQLGAAATDDFAGQSIVGITSDRNARVMFGFDSTTAMVLDSIAGVWYKWPMASTIRKVHNYQGYLCYADDAFVRVQFPGLVTDAGIAIPMDILTAPIQIGNVRGMKELYRWILSGEYKGPHTLLVDATYATEDGEYTESWTESPDPTEPYVFEYQPMIQECDSVTIRIRTAYGAGPLDSMTVELLSFELGIDGSLTRVPPTIRRGQST